MKTKTRLPGPRASRRADAHHEAGHAGMLFHLDIPFTEVFLKDGGGSVVCGPVDFPPGDPDLLTNDPLRRHLECEAMVAFAGALAANLRAGRRCARKTPDDLAWWPGSPDADYRMSLGDEDASDPSLMSVPMSRPEADALRLYLFHRTLRILTLPPVWDGVCLLAEALLSRSRLSYGEARELWDRRGADPDRLAKATAAMSAVRSPRRWFCKCNGQFRAAAGTRPKA